MGELEMTEDEKIFTLLRIGESRNKSDDTSPEFIKECEIEAQELFDKNKDAIDSFLKEFLK
jgi:hypothetical protein